MLITDIELELALDTYISPLDESYATPTGDVPTGIVATTWRTKVLITDTVLSPKLVTYISPSPEYATPDGWLPTGILSITESAQTCFTIPDREVLDKHKRKIVNVDMMIRDLTLKLWNL